MEPEPEVEETLTKKQAKKKRLEEKKAALQRKKQAAKAKTDTISKDSRQIACPGWC